MQYLELQYRELHTGRRSLVLALALALALAPLFALDTLAAFMPSACIHQMRVRLYESRGNLAYVSYGSAPSALRLRPPSSLGHRGWEAVGSKRPARNITKSSTLIA